MSRRGFDTDRVVADKPLVAAWEHNRSKTDFNPFGTE